MLLKNLACSKESAQIKVVKMWHGTCSRIHTVAVTSLGKVRDMFAGCTYLFYNLFHFMEECGILDASNEYQFAALHYVFQPRINSRHYVFQPRINSRLDIFKSGHNTGPISTKRNMSPEQLRISGMTRNQNSGRTVAREFSEGVSAMFVTTLVNSALYSILQYPVEGKTTHRQYFFKRTLFSFCG